MSLISRWFVLNFPLASHSHFFKRYTEKEYFFQLSLKQLYFAAILPSCYSQNSSSHCCVPPPPSHLKILTELIAVFTFNVTWLCDVVSFLALHLLFSHACIIIKTTEQRNDLWFGIPLQVKFRFSLIRIHICNNSESGALICSTVSEFSQKDYSFTCSFNCRLLKQLSCFSLSSEILI